MSPSVPPKYVEYARDINSAGRNLHNKIGDILDFANLEAGKHPMAMHSQMMADMKTMDAKLDRMIASMNAATGTARVDAMAAVINEMASQRKEMMMKMTGMEGQMMEHMAKSDGAMKGMHNMDPKAPGAKK